MRKLSVVIPALNEESGIGSVLKEIPVRELEHQDYETEVLVIDNGSRDNTPHIAKDEGAHVIIQPIRGYGNAYKAGFANAGGDIIATGDADMTYPFEILPDVVHLMDEQQLDFVTTDRLSHLRPEAMVGSHVWGNKLLTLVTRLLFHWPFNDSQSGMWVFRRQIWDQLDVRSSGMPFSQELKIEAFVKGFRCAEIPIDYRARAGHEKLNTISDGIGNITQLLRKKVQIASRPRRAPARQQNERQAREWES